MYSRQQVPMCAFFRPFAAPVRRSPSGGGEAGLGPDPGVWKKGRQPSAPGLCPPVAGKAPVCRGRCVFPGAHVAGEQGFSREARPPERDSGSMGVGEHADLLPVSLVCACGAQKECERARSPLPGSLEGALGGPDGPSTGWGVCPPLSAGNRQDRGQFLGTGKIYKFFRTFFRTRLKTRNKIMIFSNYAT